MEGLDKLTKAELIAKLEEVSTTEVATAIADRDNLAARVAELEAQPVGTSAEDAAELSRQVQDLTDRLAANELTKGDPRPVVKVKGEQHLIIPRKLLIDGVVYTAEQLANNQEVLDRLYDSKSDALKSVKSIEAEKSAAAAKKKA